MNYLGEYLVADISSSKDVGYTACSPLEARIRELMDASPSPSLPGQGSSSHRNDTLQIEVRQQDQEQECRPYPRGHTIFLHFLSDLHTKTDKP